MNEDDNNLNRLGIGHASLGKLTPKDVEIALSLV